MVTTCIALRLYDCDAIPHMSTATIGWHSTVAYLCACVGNWAEKWLLLLQVLYTPHIVGCYWLS